MGEMDYLDECCAVCGASLRRDPIFQDDGEHIGYEKNCPHAWREEHERLKRR